MSSTALWVLCIWCCGYGFVNAFSGLLKKAILAFFNSRRIPASPNSSFFNEL